MKNVNSFAPFLERLQQSPAPSDRVRTLSGSASGASATDQILQALQNVDSVDPSDLLSGGLDVVEMGRAIERLRSLEAIATVESNKRQLIQRGPKYDEVLSLLSL